MLDSLPASRCRSYIRETPLHVLLNMAVENSSLLNFMCKIISYETVSQSRLWDFNILNKQSKSAYAGPLQGNNQSRIIFRIIRICTYSGTKPALASLITIPVKLRLQNARWTGQTRLEPLTGVWWRQQRLDCFIFSGCSLRTAQFHKLAVGRALTHLEAMQQNRELSSCCHGDLGRLKRTLVIMTVKSLILDTEYFPVTIWLPKPAWLCFYFTPGRLNY